MESRNTQIERIYYINDFFLKKGFDRKILRKKLDRWVKKYSVL